MTETERILISGNEAVALAAFESRVALATGYPGTPATEILERLSALGGPARWAPNEKVALEVALGAAFGGGRALVAMKHVGLNVAADPLFTAAYTDVVGALVVVSADDPGMASSQNEQDNRRYAAAVGLPMLEPSDSQEAYDFTVAAIELSERWRIPVLLRMTTRVCHSKSVARARRPAAPPAPARFERDVRGRVMIPAYARPAHRRLREKLARIAAWNETGPLNRLIGGDRDLGIIVSGVAFMHARESAPSASMFKLGLTYPLPMEAIANFAAAVERCVVIEEGDPFLAEAIRAAGVVVEDKSEPFHFGELNVGRVRRILAGDDSPESDPPQDKPPELCAGCPYRPVFEILRKLDCIVSGDIGCYTLGALPPFEAVDSCVCMGGSIGIGLGLRHMLPADEARRVVSIIGDSTFVHSGLTGLIEMIYNPPPTGHLLIILDNSTTAMTGRQEHPGTGRTLDHRPTGKVVFEDLARALGIENVRVIDPIADPGQLARAIPECLGNGRINVIVTRRACVLPTGRIKSWEWRRHASGSLAMNTATPATSVIIAGLGGQGVVTASLILAEAAFRAGHDVKQSEIHGMSQRGGSVSTDVRFGPAAYSPITPPGEADYLLVLSTDQIEINQPSLRSGGKLFAPNCLDGAMPANGKSLNVALLGALSACLDFPEAVWHEAIRAALPENLHAANLKAFAVGRAYRLPVR